MKIELDQDQVILIDGGSRRDVSFAEFRMAIESSFYETTGLMPLGVRYYEKSGRRELILMEVAPKVRDVVYSHGRERKKIKFRVPFPGVVMAFRLNEGRYGGAWCFATKSPLYSTDVEFFRFPFSNTHSVDASVCWGSNEHPGRVGLYSITTLVSKFMDSVWNNHWDTNKFKYFSAGKKEIRSCLDLMRFLDGKDKFDYSILKRWGTCKQFLTSTKLF